jgi:hypothetical protein
MNKNLKKPETCPTCHQIGKLRIIVYGMPLNPVDKSKYVLGGCVVDEDRPRFYCINCDTSVS